MQEERIDTPFINVRTDFGFKRMFGTPRFKAALINLLNSLLEGEVKVYDVKYLNKEKLPEREDGRRIIYDVYCTSDVKGGDSKLLSDYNRIRLEESDSVTHHFLVEMQNAYLPPFDERIVYYTSRIVSEQGKTGWKFDMAPVITIAITNFSLPGISKRLVHDFLLMDQNTHEVLTRKYRIFFLSLPSVAKKWESCHDDLERRLFLIKHMQDMKKDSIPYREGQYPEMFEAAESDTMAQEDVVAYSASLAKLRDDELSLQYAATLAEERGLKLGEERGLKRGEYEASVRIAKAMLASGIELEEVERLTGLSYNELS